MLRQRCIANAGGLSVAVLLAASIVSCGGGAGDRARAHRSSNLERPTTVAERAWESGETRVAARLDVPDEIEPWTVTAETSRVVAATPEQGDARVLEVASGREKRIRIPLEPGQGQFNRFQFRLYAQRLRNVVASIELLAEGESILRTPEYSIESHKTNRLVRIELLRTRLMDAVPDELVLRLRGGSRTLYLWDLELHRRPWENWAQDASRLGGRNPVGEVARESAVVATDNARTCEFVVPEDGRLTLHYASFPGMTIPEAHAELRARIDVDGREISREWDVDKPEPEHQQWRFAELDMAEHSGSSASLRFELVSDADLRDYALVSTPSVFTPTDRPRTVLFVTSDTHRADHVAIVDGSVEVNTPALDALGERGVTFDDCYSSTNVTLPSHVSLLTGRSPRDTLVLDNMKGIVDEAQTLADRFREQGWATLASVSGPHLQDAWSGLGQGFDGMSSPELGSRDGMVAVDELERMLDQVPGRDAFVWLHLFDAHRPYRRVNRFLSLYWPEDRDPIPQGELAYPVSVLAGEVEEPVDHEYMNANYRAEVTYVDWVLQRVFDIPRIAQGWIAVTADHGECLGEHDVWWDHQGLYPQNLHVPMILAGEGVPGGVRVRGPAQHLDIGRTLLDLAGHEDVEFPGESMLRHVDEEPDPDTPRFALSSRATSASVEMGGWLCILNLADWRIEGMESDQEAHSVELYDLREKPLNDVAYDHPDRARRMRTLILEWLAKQEPTGWLEQGEVEDAGRAAQVEALGYTATASDGSSIWIEGDCECEYCEFFHEP